MSKQYEIKVCKGCRSPFLQNRWLYDKKNKELLIKSFEMITNEKIINLKELFELINTKKKKFDYILEWNEKKEAKDGKVKIIKHSFLVKILFDYCTVCSRLKSGYYEGILQLRNKKNSLFDDMINTVYDAVDNSNGVFISKIDEIKDGIDIYLGSNKFLKAISKKLHEKYGGVIKISKKLFSVDRKTSKEIYRGTILIRLPDFSVGNVIFLNKKYIHVKNISPKSITGIDLMMNKKTTIKYIEPEKIFDKDEIKTAMISKINPQIEVLHPETFQSTIVENMKSVKSIKEKNIDVIEIDKKIYFLERFH